MYPPGQFSPWNSPELRTAAGRPGYSAGLGPDPDEPGYSQLAVSDPSADATSTQTWAVLDDAALAGEWTSPPGRPPSQPAPGTGQAGPGTGPAGPGTGPAAPGARGSFDAADPAAASAPWQDGQPGAAASNRLTGPADGQRPDPAGPGYPGAPGAPRPGGRLAARRSREAAMDAAQDTAGDVRSRDTGGFGTGGLDTGGFGTGGVGTADRGGRDTGSRDTGGFGTGGYDTGGFDTGGVGTADRDSRDTGGFSTGGVGTADRGGRDTGSRDTGGFGTGGYDTGGFETGGFDTGGFGADEFGIEGFEAADAGTGGFGARADSGTRPAANGPAGAPPRGSRSAARGRTPAQAGQPGQDVAHASGHADPGRRPDHRGLPAVRAAALGRKQRRFGHPAPGRGGQCG